MRFELIWAGVSLALLAPCVARADEPRVANPALTGRLEGTIYGESGSEVFGSADDSRVYQERALGFGATGTMRFGFVGAANSMVFLGGVTEELSQLTLAHCSGACGAQRVSQAELGARFALGGDFHAVGFHTGLDFLPSTAFRQESELIPDLALRLGPLDEGYFLAGFGAYDAQTTLRPGLYLGGGGRVLPNLRFELHAGLHFTDDSFALRGDFTVQYRLTSTISLGAGISLQTQDIENGAVQGHASVAVGSFD